MAWFQHQPFQNPHNTPLWSCIAESLFFFLYSIGCAQDLCEQLPNDVMRWEDQEKKKKMKYEISGQERTWKHQETIEKFLNTESFSWGKVCLHSKSKGYIPAVKFFRFKIVTIQKNFKLFRIWKALKLWQSIIELILQNFLLSRIIPTHKEMCNCFFLPTFTAICITVANFKAISI